MAPRVAIGVPTYCKAHHVGDALRSLLAQTFRDFVLVVVDDASDDGTADVAEQLARRDPRITVVRNAVRLGMPRNQRRALTLARERAPEAEFFAWGSDHDLWEPEWLARLVAVLDAEPGTVLVMPRAAAIDEHGRPSGRKRWKALNTTGIEDPVERLEAVLRERAAGNAVYGLFRIEPLLQGIGFRQTVLSDRPLVCEVALHGHIRLVDEPLWHRRVAEGGIARQRRTAFPDGVPLIHRLVTPAWVHGAILFDDLVVRGRGRPRVGRLLGARAVARYLRLEVRHPWRKAIRRRLNRIIEPLLGGLQALRRGRTTRR